MTPFYVACAYSHYHKPVWSMPFQAEKNLEDHAKFAIKLITGGETKGLHDIKVFKLPDHPVLESKLEYSEVCLETSD